MAKKQLSAKEIKQQAKDERKEQKQQEKVSRKAQLQADRVEVAYQSQLETDKVAALLEEIAAGLKSGSVTVEHDKQKISITPSAVVGVRVRARQTHKTERISIRVRWPRGASPEGASDIKISS